MEKKLLITRLFILIVVIVIMRVGCNAARADISMELGDGADQSETVAPSPALDDQRGDRDEQRDDLGMLAYDGDISSTILTKFGAYINQRYRYGHKNDYVIIRTSQYVYNCYIGEIESSSLSTIKFKNSVELLTLTTSYTNNDYRLYVSTVSSPVVSIGNHPGYVYSNADGFFPLSSVVDYRASHDVSFFTLCLLSFVLSCAITKVIIYMIEDVHHL